MTKEAIHPGEFLADEPEEIGMTRTELARQIDVPSNCNREEKREAFKHEALEAWDEYQRTGLHLTGEEVDEWLAKLEKQKRE